MHRRGFFRATAATAAGAALGGCSRDDNRRQLRVFVYAGGHEETMRRVFAPAFTAATGAEAVLDAGWWDGVAKLKTSPRGRPAFDLMITDATQGYPAIRAGLFQDIDPQLVPNAARLAAPVLDHWVWRQRRGVPYPDAVMTLAYSKKHVPEPPRTWADLFRPEHAGRVGLYEAYYMSLYTFACALAEEVGRPGTARDLVRTQLEEVLRYAKDRRDRVGLWWPTTTAFAAQLPHGQYRLGNMQSPEMLQQLAADPSLGAVVPPADRAFVQVMWCIPEGTPNADLAHAAIDVIFSDECQLGFARRGSATGVLPVAQQMAREDPVWAGLYPSTAEGLAGIGFYPYDVYAEQGDQLGAFWDREVLRKS